MQSEWNDGSYETTDFIDKIGLGFGQFVGVGSASGIFFLEGLEIMMICLLQRVVGPFPVGLTTAWTTGGTLFGVFAGAAIATSGRTVAISASYCLAAIAVGAMSLVSTHSAMCFFLALLGFSIGIAYPAAFCLLHELCPKPWRFAAAAVSFLSYGIGTIVATTVVHCLAEELSTEQGFWRQVLWYSSLGASVWLLLSSFFSLWESPQFLMQSNQIVIAKDTLRFFLRTSFVAENQQAPLFDLRSLRLAADGGSNALSFTAVWKEFPVEYENLLLPSFATSFAAYSCAFFAVLDELSLSHLLETGSFLGWPFVYAELLAAAAIIFCLAVCYRVLAQWQYAEYKATLSSALGLTGILSVCLTIVGILAASEEGRGVWSRSSYGWSQIGLSWLTTICTHVAGLLVLCTGMEASTTQHRCSVVAVCVAGTQLGKLIAILVDRYLLTAMDLRWIAFILSAALCFTASMTVACHSSRPAAPKRQLLS
mmetsp:Transcript_24102/g.55663  ORF Transcript_24102/g.55663 Transcript_24102/m.55663 type:complete len:481 (+) Transcript_24102:70-1512(+)